jgi:ferredoxin-type protein NapH
MKFEMKMIQLLRRTIQVLVILLIIAIPFLTIHSGDIIPQSFVPKGSTWSITIFGYTISDPLSVLGSIFASREIYIPLLLTALIPLIFTVLLGRVFCGWLCPMNLILEINDKIRNLFKKTGNKPYNLVFKRLNKYYVLGGGLFLTVVLGFQVFPLIYPPAIVGREVFHLTFFHKFGTGIYLLLFILFFELAISRRWWCRYICPGGALLSLIGKRRLLVIRGNEKECKECSKCIRACPLGLNPVQDGTGIECDNCGICISKCPQKNLHYGLRVK